VLCNHAQLRRPKHIDFGDIKDLEEISPIAGDFQRIIEMMQFEDDERCTVQE
jgi:hypothetical protein